MKIWFLSVASMFMAAVILAFALFSYPGDGRQKSSGQQPLYYRDPMHPSYTSATPGIAPDCGMALEPVYGEAGGTIVPVTRLNSNQQQNIGIQIGRVERSAVTLTFRTLGHVVVDEARIFPLITGADGWVRRVFPSDTGSTVQKGQPLVNVYGQEYMNVQRAYLYALKNLEITPRVSPGDYRNDPKIALQEARVNLQNMGFAETQIGWLARNFQVSLDVTLWAPAAGIILVKNVYPQQRFERGTELFRIADLSSVWIVADVFGDDIRYVQAGAIGLVSLADRPDKTFSATVTKTLPRFDTDTRAHQVRLEMANPNLTFRPGMFVDIMFPVRFTAATTVPADAVIDSGLKKTVFVAKSQGIFEPRTVEVGWHFSDRVEIIRGLDPGESIVVSGHFLLDSESRMRQVGSRGND